MALWLFLRALVLVDMLELQQKIVFKRIRQLENINQLALRVKILFLFQLLLQTEQAKKPQSALIQKKNCRKLTQKSTIKFKKILMWAELVLKTFLVDSMDMIQRAELFWADLTEHSFKRLQKLDVLKICKSMAI